MTIFRHFCERLDLPVREEEVYEYVKNTGLADSIDVYEVDADPLILRGVFQLTETLAPPYGHPRRLVRIGVSGRLPETERRIVAVKELLHLFDGPREMAGTEQAVDRLITELVIPVPLTASIPTANDRLGLAAALAILLPKAAIDTLTPAIADSRLSFEDVAHIARLPVAYVRFAFSQWWPDVLETVEGRYSQAAPPA